MATSSNKDGKTPQKNNRQSVIQSSSTRKKTMLQQPGSFASNSVVSAMADDAKIRSLVCATLEMNQAYGSNSLPIDGILCYSPTNIEKESLGNVIYRIGKYIVIFNNDTNSQHFLNRPKNVIDVLHVAISPNSRHLSVCETIRENNDSAGHAQVSIYNLNTFNLITTLTYQCDSEFILSSFTGDGKHLATYTGENDNHIVLWLWEKNKLIKSMMLPSPATRLRSATSLVPVLTTSGLNHLKGFYLGSNGEFKTITFFSGPKENENFIDHIWLPSSGDYVHKLVILVGFSSLVATTAAEAQKMQKQIVYIFEGMDVVVNQDKDNATNNKVKKDTADIVPIGMELAQTLALKVDGAKGYYATAITATSKGFILTGSNGFISLFERSDDNKEGFVEISRMNLGDLNIIASSVTSMDSNLMMLLNDSRILKVSLEERKDVLQLKSLEKIEISQNVGVDNTSHTATLVAGGFHDQNIIAADIALDRPIVVTIASDNTARVWNYESKKCELKHNFVNDEPLAVSVHPNGFSVLISFKDRVRLYNILTDKLNLHHEAILKNCRELKFSNGGHVWAAASSINVLVYDTRTFKVITSLQGHTLTVRKLAWSPGDQILFSAGMDGNVYGWPVNGGSRIDIVSSNSRSSAYLGFTVDCQNMLFPKINNDNLNEDGESEVDSSTVANLVNNTTATTANAAVTEYPSKTIIISMQDGNIRLPEWSLDMKRGTNTESKYIFGNSVSITCLCLSSDHKILYAGTGNGCIRLYAWPPIGEASDGVYYEKKVHNSPVVSIKESPIGNAVISVSEDRSIFIFDLKKIISETPKTEGKDDHEEILDDDNIVFNSDVVLLSNESLDEHIQAVVNLQKLLQETQQKYKFQTMQKENEFHEEMKKVSNMNDLNLLNERSKFEKRATDLDKKIKDLTLNIETKEIEGVKLRAEIENRYEHKLADQMERYDRLHEDMELLKQKCEALIASEREALTKQLNELKNEAKVREKKLRSENKRILDDRRADESAFKEILDQQEDEYEDELKQLISAAENELVNERDTITKLRTLVQTKNTKLDQLKKKLLELSMASKARLALLANEKKEKQKLMDIIEHYKLNLKEREDALAEKENIIVELRSSKQTLENFRFVLDHRLQQLSAERGPIGAHIVGLERHISTMYEELVEEFDYKRETASTLEQRKKKIGILTSELKMVRDDNAKKEQYVSNFKRELGNIITSNAVGKDLEEAVRLLYRKYVRGETGEAGHGHDSGAIKATGIVKEIRDELLNKNDDDELMMMDGSNSSNFKGIKMNKALAQQVEEELVETAKEAERQKDFVKKEANSLKNRLQVTKDEAMRLSRSRLTENSNLLYECNDLRRNLKQLERKYEGASKELFEAKETITKLKDTIAVSFALGRGSTHQQGISDNMTSENGLEEGKFGHDNATMTMTDADTNFKESIDSKPNNINTEVHENNHGIKPWIVHNALIRSNTTGNIMYQRVSSDQQSVGSLHSLHGKGAHDTNFYNEDLNRTEKNPISSKKVYVHPNTLKVMSKEIDMLTEQLNLMSKEKEIQRLEIDRMRNTLIKYNKTNTNHDTRNKNVNDMTDNLNLGSLSVGFKEVEVNHSLTSADVNGHPSNEDIKDLVLNPVPIVLTRNVKSNNNNNNIQSKGLRPKTKVNLPEIKNDNSLTM